MPMIEGWKQTTLGEVAEINEMVVDKNYPHLEIEYIDIASVEERRVLHVQKLMLQEAPSRAKRIVRDNDTLISTVRPNLKHYCHIKRAAPNLVASTGFAVITAKKADPAFLYYLVTTDEYTDYLTKIADSHTSTYPSFNPKVIENSVFNLPPLSEQRAIAAVLSSFDDKIELLRRQNKTLEAIAQAIFKEWFVKFKVKGEQLKLNPKTGLPEGWRRGKVEDLCSIIASGGTPSTSNINYYNGNINWFSTKELQDNFLLDSDKKITKDGLRNSSAKMFPMGSVVMALYAAPTVGRLGILGKESTFNQAACGFVANEEVCCYEYIYLYLLQSRIELNNLANGAAQQNLNVGIVKNFPAVIPTIEIMQSFKAIVVPIFAKKFNNTLQIQTLSKLRDTLLPKLMKGEIRVKREK